MKSVRFCTIIVASLALFHAASTTAQVSKTTSVMTFQRMVDSASPGPAGTVVLSKVGAVQSFSVDVRNLAGTSYALFFGDSLATNSLVYLIAALDRAGTNDHWRLQYSATGAAPSQLPVADLDDLAGVYLFVADPSALSNFVDAVLFTQVQALTATPKALSFKARVPLVLPSVPPSPASRGYVQTQFVGNQGRSVFDVRATKLPGGNAFTLWMEDAFGSGILTNVAALTLSTSTRSGRFTRDTRKGETLPLGASTVSDLSGRVIEIRDAFDDVHLMGVIP